jgi:hypothetical protein
MPLWDSIYSIRLGLIHFETFVFFYSLGPDHMLCDLGFFYQIDPKYLQMFVKEKLEKSSNK